MYTRIEEYWQQLSNGPSSVNSLRHTSEQWILSDFQECVLLIINSYINGGHTFAFIGFVANLTVKKRSGCSD